MCAAKATLPPLSPWGVGLGLKSSLAACPSAPPWPGWPASRRHRSASLRLSDIVSDVIEQVANWLRAPVDQFGAPSARADHTRRHLLQSPEALLRVGRERRRELGRLHRAGGGVEGGADLLAERTGPGDDTN